MTENIRPEESTHESKSEKKAWARPRLKTISHDKTEGKAIAGPELPPTFGPS